MRGPYPWEHAPSAHRADPRKIGSVALATSTIRTIHDGKEKLFKRQQLRSREKPATVMQPVELPCWWTWWNTGCNWPAIIAVGPFIRRDTSYELSGWTARGKHIICTLLQRFSWKRSLANLSNLQEKQKTRCASFDEEQRNCFKI